MLFILIHPYDKINASSFVQYNAIAFDEFDQKTIG